MPYLAYCKIIYAVSVFFRLLPALAHTKYPAASERHFSSGPAVPAFAYSDFPAVISAVEKTYHP